MNKKILFVLIHLPVWIVAFLVAFGFGTEKFPGGTDRHYLWHTLTLWIWFLCSFYIFYAFLVPRFLEKGKMIRFGIYAGLFVLIIIPLLVILSVIGFKLGSLAGHSIFSLEFLLQWIMLSFLTAFCSTLGTFYKFGTDWFDNLNLKKELENVRLQSELATLKSRLNPHFLFNTLNNIDTLIQQDPAKASTVLTMLSDLFRYMVYETENEQISIHKELEMINKYIELEKIRLTNPEVVSLTCAVDEDFLTPPMLFLPFIENAFKHSNLNQPNAYLSILITAKNRELAFRCTNTIALKENEAKTQGVGLKLIKERLNLLYPDSHKLQIVKNQDVFDVILSILEHRV